MEAGQAGPGWIASPGELVFAPKSSLGAIEIFKAEKWYDHSYGLGGLPMKESRLGTGSRWL